MNNLRNYKLLILVLVLSNLFLIWKLSVREEFPPHHPHPKAHISKVLKLTGDKKRMADSMETVHFARKTVLVDAQRKRREKLVELLSKENSGENVDKLLQSIASKNLEIDHMTYHYFLAIRSLCNNNQQSKLDELAKNILIPKRKHPPRGG